MVLIQILMGIFGFEIKKDLRGNVKTVYGILTEDKEVASKIEKATRFDLHLHMN